MLLVQLSLAVLSVERCCARVQAEACAAPVGLCSPEQTPSAVPREGRPGKVPTACALWARHAFSERAAAFAARCDIARYDVSFLLRQVYRRGGPVVGL